MVFKDESYKFTHDSGYLMTMVPHRNKRNTNSSKFMITQNPLTSLDEQQVVFGRLKAIDDSGDTGTKMIPDPVMKEVIDLIFACANS